MEDYLESLTAQGARDRYTNEVEEKALERTLSLIYDNAPTSRELIITEMSDEKLFSAWVEHQTELEWQLKKRGFSVVIKGINGNSLPVGSQWTILQSPCIVISWDIPKEDRPKINVHL